MKCSQQRTIDYLRVSVTDRCNFRCVYCMPPEGVKPLTHQEILRYEELLKIIDIFSKNGIRKVRITGGEPLVRKGVVGFIHALSQNPRITDISLTTNGSLLFPALAQELKAAGLARVNISLDTVSAERFEKITGSDSLRAALQGIEAALEAGLHPVKINTVLTEFLREDELVYFVQLVERYPVAVRFIEYMPIGECRTKPGMTIRQVKALLTKVGGPLTPVQGPAGNGPANYYRMSGAQGEFGFIAPISEHFCACCNRLRLTADGKLKPCLLSDTEIDLKSLLRSGAGEEEISNLFFQAIGQKPERHSLYQETKAAETARKMSQIGG